MYYQPDVEVCIDERMVHSKAIFSFKQYIPNKPCKGDFKFWCLCDPRNGYAIYRGKRGEIISGNGLGYDIVFSLLKDFLDQWFSLYIDHFYTSPVLANDLFLIILILLVLYQSTEREFLGGNLCIQGNVKVKYSKRNWYLCERWI